MLRTAFCGRFGLEVPIIQAAIPPYTSPELVSAVSNAGALGTYASAFKSVDQARQEINRIRELTDRPFTVNFVMPAFDPDVFEYVLSDPPPVISFAVGHPGERIRRAHDAGAKVIAQVHTVEQARDIASSGADAIIAQGWEAGGLGGSVSLMPLLPQVVDAVHPLPVLGAGGIADGRGLAAALVLGAQGVNVGTRFIASEESAADRNRRQKVVEAQSQDAVRVRILDEVIPRPDGAYETSMRSLRTSFLEKWGNRETLTREEVEQLRQELFSEEDRFEELIFAAGQSAGLIDSILPVAEIIQQMASEAEAALARAGGLTAPAA